MIIIPFFVSCEKTQRMDDSIFQLYYSGVTDIGPSMSFKSGLPTYIGEKPDEFEIIGVKFNSEAFQTDCFVIDPASGSFSLQNTKDLSVGEYLISVACVSNGKRYEFKDIIKVRFFPPVPEGVTVEPNSLSIALNDFLTTKASAKVKSDGNHVSISSYSLVQEKGKEYFSINEKGEITTNKSFKGDVTPGDYSLNIILKTGAGESMFENALNVKVTSKPLSLIYSPNDVKVETNSEFSSNKPEYLGSVEEINYSISKVNPASDMISIDASTGVVSVKENNGFTIGDKFVVSVKVKNSFGENVFEDVLNLNVVAFIKPIENFAYENVEIFKKTGKVIALKAGFIGDDVTFELGDNVPNGISINNTTGEITIEKGNNLEVGSYQINVKAKNIKGEESTSFNITVIDNPNVFNVLRYGNNLNLTPVENYANQFRFNTEEEFAAAQLKVTTDIPNGVEVEWSVETKRGMSGTKITEDGTLIFNQPDEEGNEKTGWKKANCGLVFVTATTGKGTQGEFSKTVPVFFNFASPVSGVRVLFTPFVFQVNSKTGGKSATPVIEGAPDVSKFLMDYRRSFSFYNINGPETQIDGNRKVENSYMRYMWKYYYTVIIGGHVVNYGAKNPMSYYANTKKGYNLSQALGYVDKESLQIVINPNKWYDANGVPAKGAVIGQITFVTDGKVEGVNKGKKIFPVCIWLDDNF